MKYSGVVASTGKPRCESPSDSGTIHATALCLAMACRLSMRMLLVAPPTRKTAYSSNCTAPVRAPTMRSVPLTDCEKRFGQAHLAQQLLRRCGGRSAGPDRALAPHRREAARQRHVVEHMQVRQQVELLEDVAHVVGAERIAPRPRQRRPGRSEQTHSAFMRQEHSGQQSQQRALAAAAGTVEKQGGSCRHLEPIDAHAVPPGAGPAEAKVLNV